MSLSLRFIGDKLLRSTIDREREREGWRGREKVRERGEIEREYDREPPLSLTEKVCIGAQRLLALMIYLLFFKY